MSRDRSSDGLVGLQDAPQLINQQFNLEPQ
jgi:hypothetical protein